MHAPEAYGLDAEGAEVFFANLEAAAEFEWAHCLAVALETDFRVTGSVILQSPEVSALLQQHLVDRQVPPLLLGTPAGGVEAVDVPALLRRLESA